jgi:hypothetical protein
MPAIGVIARAPTLHNALVTRATLASARRGPPSDGLQ